MARDGGSDTQKVPGAKRFPNFLFDRGSFRPTISPVGLADRPGGETPLLRKEAELGLSASSHF